MNPSHLKTKLKNGIDFLHLNPIGTLDSKINLIEKQFNNFRKKSFFRIFFKYILL